MCQDSLYRETICDHSLPRNLNEIETMGLCTASDASIMESTIGISEQSKGVFLFSIAMAGSAINRCAEDLEIGVVNSPPNQRKTMVSPISSPRLWGRRSTCREAFPTKTCRRSNSADNPCISPKSSGLACTIANNMDAIEADSSRFMVPSSTGTIDKVHLDDAVQLYRSRPYYSDPNQRRSKVTIEAIQAYEARLIQQQRRNSLRNPTYKRGKYQMIGSSNNSCRTELMKWFNDVYNCEK